MYSAEISRANPTIFVFLLDQSASMQDPIGGARANASATSSRMRLTACSRN